MFRLAILATLFLYSTVAVLGERTEYQFARYQVILDRMPFGKPPPQQQQGQAKQEPEIKEAGKNSVLLNLRLCALREVGGGEVRVGFVNIKEKPQKTYFLYKGQSQDGIKVVEVDYAMGTALVQTDDAQRLLVMEAGADGVIPGSTKPGAVSKVRPGVRTAPGKANNRGARPKPKKKPSYSQRLKERRKLEEEKRKQIAEEKAKFTAEELKEHFKQLQMEYIRTGQPALPIQLTPEQDAQLVQEGVLEPLEPQYPQ